MKFTKSELQRLSSIRGLADLLANDVPDFKAALNRLNFKSELKQLHIELIKMQNWVVKEKERVLIIFEGGEFAGKGGAIGAFTERLNPRSARTVALPKPTKIQRQQWYYKRYISQLPIPGEIVFFDRSWYNRAVVEPVNGFCTKKEYKQFIKDVNLFESMLCNDGIRLIKLYFSVSKKVQAKRIERIRNNPLRRWELSEVDENAQSLWPVYKDYESAMFKHTHTKTSPWKIINSDSEFAPRLEAIRYVLSLVPFKTEN